MYLKSTFFLLSRNKVMGKEREYVLTCMTYNYKLNHNYYHHDNNFTDKLDNLCVSYEYFQSVLELVLIAGHN